MFSRTHLALAVAAAVIFASATQIALASATAATIISCNGQGTTPGGVEYGTCSTDRTAGTGVAVFSQDGTTATINATVTTT